ncbi:MotE family protein [Halobacillus sp. H74]|uniref:MotE family protein n=1 Tax=Halobacillus sp. H74 TaxID=3457436 RepID=UPI003FCD9C6D
MAKGVHNDKPKGNKIQKVFFAIVIPFIFLLTLTLIVLTLSGINVFEEAEKYAKKIPGVSEVTSTDEPASDPEEMDRLQAMLANKDAEIEQLQQDADQKQTTIEEMDQQILKLEKELEDRLPEDGEDPNQKAKDLAASFQEMDPEEAAPIIGSMSQTLAVQVMREVASEERGEILGQMDPEAAAEIASILLEE